MSMNTIKTATSSTRLLRSTIPRFQQSQRNLTLKRLTTKSPAKTPPLPSLLISRGQTARPSNLIIRTYSTKPTNPTSNPKSQSQSQSQRSDIEPPVFDFKSLGIKGPVKFVVIAVISVLGTIETVFWVKVGWRWWMGESGQGEAEGKEQGKA